VDAWQLSTEGVDARPMKRAAGTAPSYWRDRSEEQPIAAPAPPQDDEAARVALDRSGWGVHMETETRETIPLKLAATAAAVV